MLNLFKQRAKTKAIVSYIQDLAPAAVKRYGLRDQYTVMQVQKTIRDLGLNAKFIHYAIALMRHEASDNSIDLHQIDQDYLDYLRYDIADMFFDGDTTFDLTDIVRLGSPGRWGGGHHNNWMANHFGKTGY